MQDLHVHVWPHRPGAPVPTFELLKQYCDAAESRGITQIAITEHSHRFTRIADQVLPHWERPSPGDLADATDHVLEVEGGADLDAYVEALLDAQRQGLPLLVGLEVDHLPGTTEAMANVLADYPFDVLLGSVHWLDDWLFDAYGNPVFAQEWIDRDTDDVFSRYVDAVLELARSGLVDVLAHLDVIKVAGHIASRLSEHESRLVEGLAATNMAIEFSSAGLRKPAEATYPSLPLLDRIIAAGLALTTASDAHTVDQIGAGFDTLTAELDNRRVRHLVTFDRRTRSTLDHRA